MTWIVIALMAVVALGVMRLAGLRGGLMTLAGAALAFAGAGYVLQGRPDLPGQPRERAEQPAPLPLTQARAALMDQFSTGARWLVMADALESRGHTQDAANLIAAQLRRHPNDYDLWVGLGNALADHAHGLTPAADAAFERAKAIGPKAPAAPFFHGLALARSGRVGEGVAEWKALLATAPGNASWRPFVDNAVRMVGGEPEPAAASRAQAGE